VVRRLRVAGWVLLGLAVLAAAVIVVLGALRARDTAEFNRWVGWATVAALPVGAVGVVLMVLDKIIKSTSNVSVGVSMEDADHEQRQSDPSDSGPLHPVGIDIHARALRNEKEGRISAEGTGSLLKVRADDFTNVGTMTANQNGPGVRLVDHLRLIAGNIKSAAADWDRQPPESRVPFATYYVRYGWGRQASELYDSAVKVHMHTAIPRTVFECASTLDEAQRVAGQLLQWTEELSTGSA
jgi:hypothetical protein